MDAKILNPIIQGATRPPIDWLITDLIPHRVVTLLISDSGIGKSFLAYDLALAVTSGQQFLGRECKQKGKVLYFDDENAEDIVDERMWALAKGRRISSVDGSLFFYSRELAREQHPAVAMAHLVREHKPKLVVVDTFSCLFRNYRQGMENDSALMKQLLVKTRLAAEGSTLVILHHEAKDMFSGGKPRGSGAISGDVDAYYTLTKTTGAVTGRFYSTILSPGKTRVLDGCPKMLITPEVWPDKAILLHGQVKG